MLCGFCLRICKIGWITCEWTILPCGNDVPRVIHGTTKTVSVKRHNSISSTTSLFSRSGNEHNGIGKDYSHLRCILGICCSHHDTKVGVTILPLSTLTVQLYIVSKSFPNCQPIFRN